MLVKNTYPEDFTLSSKDTAYILDLCMSHLALYRTGRRQGGPEFIRDGNRYLYSEKSVYDFLLKKYQEPLNNGIDKLNFTLKQFEENNNG